MPTTAADTAYAGRRGGDGVGHRGLDRQLYLSRRPWGGSREQQVGARSGEATDGGGGRPVVNDPYQVTRR